MGNSKQDIRQFKAIPKKTWVKMHKSTKEVNERRERNKRKEGSIYPDYTNQHFYERAITWHYEEELKASRKNTDTEEVEMNKKPRCSKCSSEELNVTPMMDAYEHECNNCGAYYHFSCMASMQMSKEDSDEHWKQHRIELFGVDLEEQRKNTDTDICTCPSEIKGDDRYDAELTGYTSMMGMNCQVHTRKNTDTGEE